jgi:hypothetical protein
MSNKKTSQVEGRKSTPKIRAAHRKYCDALTAVISTMVDLHAMRVDGESDAKIYRLRDQSIINLTRAYLRWRHPHVDAQAWIKAHKSTLPFDLPCPGGPLERLLDRLVEVTTKNKLVIKTAA